MDETSRFWHEALVQDIYITGRVAHVDLSYPNCGDNPHTIEVGLQDVRAADDIRISYDFERDGWKIEQQEREEFVGTDGSILPGVEGEWREVAFIKAWGLTTIVRGRRP